MSTIFEAFVISNSKKEINSFLEKTKIDIPLVVVEIQENLTAILINLPRHERFNPGRNEKIALKLANKFSRCLVIYWDDRIDLSLANLYDQNGLVEEFNDKDEIWIELKENNCPNFQGLKYSRLDIESNFGSYNNFVCIFNAVDAALHCLQPFCEFTCIGFIEKLMDSDGV